MAKEFTLTEGSVRKLRDDHQRLQQQFYNLQQLVEARVQAATPGRIPYLGKPTAEIAGRIGNTPGTGTVTLWELTAGGDVAATTRTKPAINVSTAKCEADKLVELIKIRGRLYIVPDGGIDVDVDETAIVQVASANANLTLCMWSGYTTTVSLPGAAPWFCEDRFSLALPCLLVALNSDGGSLSDPMITLTVGDRYIGRLLGTVTGTPIYAIRATQLQKDVIEGWVYTPFNKQSGNFLIVVRASYTDAVDEGEQVMVENFVRGGPKPNDPDDTYMFEGEYGAQCRAVWDASSGVYRADWVECAQRSPVEVYVPSGSPNSPLMPMAAAVQAGMVNNYGY